MPHREQSSLIFHFLLIILTSRPQFKPLSELRFVNRSIYCGPVLVDWHVQLCPETLTAGEPRQSWSSCASHVVHDALHAKLVLRVTLPSCLTILGCYQGHSNGVDIKVLQESPNLDSPWGIYVATYPQVVVAESLEVTGFIEMYHDSR